MQNSNDIIVRFGNMEDADTTLDIQSSVIAGIRLFTYNA